MEGQCSQRNKGFWENTGKTITRSVNVVRIKIKSRASEMAYLVKVLDTAKADRLEFSSWGPHGRRKTSSSKSFSTSTMPHTCTGKHTYTNKEI